MPRKMKLPEQFVKDSKTAIVMFDQFCFEVSLDPYTTETLPVKSIGIIKLFDKFSNYLSNITQLSLFYYKDENGEDVEKIHEIKEYRGTTNIVNNDRFLERVAAIKTEMIQKEEITVDDLNGFRKDVKDLVFDYMIVKSFNTIDDVQDFISGRNTDMSIEERLSGVYDSMVSPVIDFQLMFAPREDVHLDDSQIEFTKKIVKDNWVKHVKDAVE